MRWVEQAAEGKSAAAEDAGVDHGGLLVFLAEQSLEGGVVVAVFEEVGGKGVPQGVAVDALEASGVGVVPDE